LSFLSKVRAVNVTMRAFQKAGQFQLSSVTDGLLARRRYTKKSTDSCSSTSSSTTTSTAAVVPTGISPSTLPHTRRLCGNGVCRCRHAPCPPTNDSLSSSSFDFSDERLSQLIDQYPLTTTTTTPPKRYGMTLRSRATAVISGITHEFASPAPPPPLLVPSLSSSSSSSSIITDVLPSINITGEKRPLTSPIHHSLAPVNKKLKRSGTITIDD
jgi:hypothetical protein